MGDGIYVARIPESSTSDLKCDPSTPLLNLSGPLYSALDDIITIGLSNLRTPETPIAALRNIGPKSAGLLAEIGVNTLSDLEEMGAVFAYRVLKHRFAHVSILMLYALEATIRDVHWLSLTEEDKNGLRAAAEAELQID
ncbi:MAG: hypothetical protein BMS9Abin05_1768 [Rhodothermia bacterium]|nr:MAG: hypothetical protein BMS9Abin05_1768 [Rhodothermia bacterium]